MYVPCATRVGSATSEGTPTLAADYSAASGDLYFGQESYQWIYVSIANDTHSEPAAEEFYVDLSVSYGGAPATPTATGTGTIYDGDGEPLVTIDPASCRESDGQMTFTLHLTNASQSPAEVTWETASLDGSAPPSLASATAGDDYTPTTGTAVFQPGETQTTVTVPILDDSYCEPDEGFAIRTTGTSGCAVDPNGASSSGQLTAVGIIEDDDASVDFAIDSNNDGTIDATDDPVEDIEGVDQTPGKIILVQDADSDHDGLANWADGFDWLDGVTEDNSSTGSFVPLQMSLVGIDLERVALEIIYDGSDPLALVDAWTLPDEGHLRLWKKDEGQSRNPQSALTDANGDYLPAGVYSASMLGLTSSTLTLYLEATKPSATTADQAVTVRVYPNGQAAPGELFAEDRVRLTATRITVMADQQDGSDPFERQAFITTGLPDAEAGDAPGSFETYKVYIYDPRAGFDHYHLDGHAMPVVRVGNHYESPTPFLALAPHDADLLQQDEPLELNLQHTCQFGYYGTAMPNDYEAYTLPLPWSVASNLSPEQVSLIEDPTALAVDSTAADGQYFATLNDAASWDLSKDTDVELMFRIVEQGASGTDGAFKLVFGDDGQHWEIGVCTDRLVTYPGGVRTETLLSASLLDGQFHTLRIEKAAGNAVASVLLDDVFISAEPASSGAWFGIGWGDPGGAVAGRVEYSQLEWEFDNAGSPIIPVETVRPSDVAAGFDSVVLESDAPVIQYNPNEVYSKAALKKFDAVAECVAKNLAEIEADMVREGWVRPAGNNSLGAFGDEVHSRLSRRLHRQKLGDYGTFYADVGIRTDTKKIVDVGVKSGKEKVLQADLVFCSNGYKLKRGSVLDTNKVIPFEIKTSANRSIDTVVSKAQLERYEKVFGWKQTRVATSKYGMNAAGQMVENPNFMKRIKVLGVVAVAGGIAYQWLSLDPGDLEAAERELDQAMTKYASELRKNPKSDEAFLSGTRAATAVTDYIRRTTVGLVDDSMNIADAVLLRRLAIEWAN